MQLIRGIAYPIKCNSQVLLYYVCPFSFSVGKKVNDAAKEVTDFLNDAVGKT